MTFAEPSGSCAQFPRKYAFGQRFRPGSFPVTHVGFISGVVVTRGLVTGVQYMHDSRRCLRFNGINYNPNPKDWAPRKSYRYVLRQRYKSPRRSVRRNTSASPLISCEEAACPVLPFASWKKTTRPSLGDARILCNGILGYLPFLKNDLGHLQTHNMQRNTRTWVR